EEDRRARQKRGQRGQVPIDEQASGEEEGAPSGGGPEEKPARGKQKGEGTDRGQRQGDRQVPDIADEAAGRLAAAKVRLERERLVEASRLENRNHRVDRGDGEKRAEQKPPSSRECPGSADRQQKSIEKHRPRRGEGE